MPKCNRTAKNRQRGGGDTRFRKFLKKLQNNTKKSRIELLHKTFSIQPSRAPSSGIQLKLSPFRKMSKSRSKSR
jgi:hypothetical protein